MAVYTVITVGDWQGLYDHENIVWQGSKISLIDTLYLVRHNKVEVFGCYEAYACQENNWGVPLPSKLSQVQIQLKGELLPFYEYLEKAEE